MSWAVYDGPKYTAESFEAWLEQYKPTNPDTARYAWIAIRGTAPAQALHEDSEEANEYSLTSQAEGVITRLTARVNEIKADENITKRGKKSEGRLSEKQTCELEYGPAAEQLQNLAIAYNVIMGKWMFYPSSERIDEIWETIARAVIEPEGVLREHVRTAKVTPYIPQALRQKNSGQMICVYVEDSWDIGLVRRVYEILVVQLGLNSKIGYKPDIYTIAGLYSKDPCGMPPTIYTGGTFFTPAEIAARRDAYLETQENSPEPDEPEEGEDAQDQDQDQNAPPAAVVLKTLVKVKAKGTGFVDDSDSEETEEEGDDSATEPEEDDEPPRKKTEAKK